MRRLLQVFLFGLVFLFAVWIRLNPFTISSLALVAMAVGLSQWAPAVSLGAVWMGTLLAVAGAVSRDFTWDSYYALTAALVAMALGLAPRERFHRLWKATFLGWLVLAAFLWLAAGYFENRRGEFFMALLAAVAVLAICGRTFSGAAPIVNTIIFLLVGLPVADLALRPQSRQPVRAENCRLYYSFDAAHGDPGAFGRWQEFYEEQFGRMGLAVFEKDTNGAVPFHLRPNSRGMMMSCPVAVNSLGFRGPEFSIRDTKVFRIVALGESTTFGMTIEPGDRPWPEMLQEIIRTRLKTSRPVQVINAGVPAYILTQNLWRMPREILPLRPDLIISYHGANGFSLIDSSLLPPLGPAPPLYKERPVKILAEAEHRIRLLIFNRQHQAPPRSNRVARPLESRYAAVYRQFIDCARTNGVRLALANFSMAVNEGSSQAVIDFYRGGGSRAAYAMVRANAAHSEMVRALASEHPEVIFIDTHPGLDGDHEKFIDVIHMTDEGRRQLAENIFAGIRPWLEHELGAGAH